MYTKVKSTRKKWYEKKVQMATLLVECQVTALSFADTTKKICKHKLTVEYNKLFSTNNKCSMHLTTAYTKLNSLNNI